MHGRFAGPKTNGSKNEVTVFYVNNIAWSTVSLTPEVKLERLSIECRKQFRVHFRFAQSNKPLFLCSGFALWQGLAASFDFKAV